MKRHPKTGSTYRTNSGQEVTRRQRQIDAGKLRAANGLIPSPVIVIPTVSENLVVEAAPKPKRVRKPKAVAA